MVKLGKGGVVDGVLGGVWSAIQQLLTKALVKKRSIARNNPLIWWMAILVRSASAGEADFISNGRFKMNPMPMDVDIAGRAGAMVQYSKVLVADGAFLSWEGKREWVMEIQADFKSVDMEWINHDNGSRPDESADRRTCASAAWQKLLEHLHEHVRTRLGGEKGSCNRKFRGDDALKQANGAE